MASVSAIIPVYNGEATIAEAIDSALALADECDLEVVVVDDGSTDSTSAILWRYGDRIKVLQQKHLGVSAARNHAVRESRGQYLAFLDADDLWLPGRLAKAVVILDSDPTVGLVYSCCRIIDVRSGGFQGEFGSEGPPSLDEMLEMRFSFKTPTVTMRRQIFEHCGGFDERLGVGEDVLVWLRARECSNFVNIPEVLVLVRTAPDPRNYVKYPLRAREVFERVVYERYGRRVKPLIRLAHIYWAQQLFVFALCQIDDGNPRGALRTLIELLRYRPSYLLSQANPVKLVSRHNLRRILALVIPVAANAPPNGAHASVDPNAREIARSTSRRE